MKRTFFGILLSAALLTTFASCAKVQTYSVSWDLNYDGAPVVSPTMVENGKTLEEPDDPTRAGYDFIAWYLDQGCTQFYDFSTAVTNDFTLFADWKAASVTRSEAIGILSTIDSTVNSDGFAYPTKCEMSSNSELTVDGITVNSYVRDHYSADDRFSYLETSEESTGSTTVYQKHWVYYSGDIVIDATDTNDVEGLVPTKTYRKHTGSVAESVWDGVEERFDTVYTNMVKNGPSETKGMLEDLATPLPPGRGESYRSTGTGNLIIDLSAVVGNTSTTDTYISYDESLLRFKVENKGGSIGDTSSTYSWNACTLQYPNLDDFTELVDN